MEAVVESLSWLVPAGSEDKFKNEKKSLLIGEASGFRLTATSTTQTHFRLNSQLSSCIVGNEGARETI